MPLTNTGSKFVTQATALSSTNDTDVYVVPNNFSSHIEHFMISNNHSGAVTFTLKFFEASTSTTYTLFSAHSLATISSQSIFTVDKPLHIRAGDKLIVAAGSADKLVVVVSVEELFDPTT
tara:strand:+ start:462 stop:821 length:360 start_codon:yes stop_codon:yes gene_type:complete